MPKESAVDTKKWVKLLQAWTCARNAVSSFKVSPLDFTRVTVTSSFLNGSAILYRNAEAKW